MPGYGEQMNAAANSNYYTSQKNKLLKNFDKVSIRLAKYLDQLYGKNFAVTIIAETRAKFEEIIPEIPYIGGRKNQFTKVMVYNGWIISFFKAMKTHGKSTEEVIKVCSAVADHYMQSLPRVVLWFAGKAAFGNMILNRMKRQAEKSQERKYPQDFVYSLIRGDGGKFDWALEFTECAVNKFYTAQQVEELKPYCNFFDVTYSRYLKMGIDASKTIGLGCPTCRLEYKRGRTTLVPDRLIGILPKKNKVD